MNAPKSATDVTAGFTRYRVLLGAIIVQLILGTMYGYSIFWKPLEAKIFPPIITQEEKIEKLAAGEDISDYTVVATAEDVQKQSVVQKGYLKYAFSICILTFAIVMVIAGRVQDIKGPRMTAIIGAVLMGTGFLCAGRMENVLIFYLAHAVFWGVVCILMLMVYHALFGKVDQEEMPIVQYIPMGIGVICIVGGVLLGQQYADKMDDTSKLFMIWGTVGFLAGAGIGFAYVCPLAALVKWFPNNKGLVSGLAVAGFGFGAYLFTRKDMGAVNYIEEHGIITFFTIHGLICLFGVTLGAMMLTNPPGVVSAKKVIADSTWQDTLRRPSFYILWLMFFSGAVAGLMVIGILKGFAGDQLVKAAGEGISVEETQAHIKAGATAVGILAIFNATGRIVWGFISDFIGRTGAMVAMFTFQAVMLIFFSSLESEFSLAVGASIVGFNFGGNFALFPSATADLFGAKNLGANYGWVFTSYGIAGVVGIAAGNIAKTETGSYTAAFIMAAVLCLISAGLAVGLRISQKQAQAAV